jgi:pyruvate/2-oxoglutarate/acetoin dehydrogenase E1 component
MSTVETSEVTYAEALRLALDAAMAEDHRIVVLGQDVVVGFPFGITRGLADSYGVERVLNTPISEAGTMGCGVGAAVAGLRPVVEVDFPAFLLLGFDQLVNNAAKLRYVSGGQLRVPLVVRVGQGPLGSFAAQHSQSLHGWLANVPGLAVCAPTTVQDAYDLLRWSLRQNDPVIFCEDMRLYRTKGQLQAGDGATDPRAEVVREGRDATCVAFGFGARQALVAAEELAAEGIELEVLDLKLISPLDADAIEASCRRTGRVLCVADDPLLGGLTATLAAVATERAYSSLVAPVLRLGARHAPAPYAPELEQLIFPSSTSIAQATRRLVAWRED